MSLVAFRVWLLDRQGKNLVREVKINDQVNDRYTGKIIYKEPGHHTISLVGETDFTPPEREITLSLDDQEIQDVEFYLLTPKPGGGGHDA